MGPTAAPTVPRRPSQPLCGRLHDGRRRPGQWRGRYGRTLLLSSLHDRPIGKTSGDIPCPTQGLQPAICSRATCSPVCCCWSVARHTAATVTQVVAKPTHPQFGLQVPHAPREHGLLLLQLTLQLLGPPAVLCVRRRRNGRLQECQIAGECAEVAESQESFVTAIFHASAAAVAAACLRR